MADKVCICAEMLLDLAGCEEALVKFREIVATQGSNSKVSSFDIVLGRFLADVISDRSGLVRRIFNKAIV